MDTPPLNFTGEPVYGPNQTKEIPFDELLTFQNHGQRRVSVVAWPTKTGLQGHYTVTFQERVK